MQSLTELYRFGKGPSSSHTIAPQRAAKRFREDFPGAHSYRVTLFGSLAATGRGHLSDQAIIQAFTPAAVEILWKPLEELRVLPNGMLLAALGPSGEVLGEREEYSTGGGALLSDKAAHVYPAETMAEILSSCQEAGESFWEYVQRFEGQGILAFLEQVWQAMCGSVVRGIRTEGVLPGGLRLRRKACSFHRRARALESGCFRTEAFLAAYAYAVAEENACGGDVVSAPTCGASGVLPAILTSLSSTLECRDEDILHALATAGLFGNLVKRNASISGAVVGCQGEIGTACAMAAAAATQLLGGTPPQIEYAAEMGLEHHLGLTCDPVAGLVQIPCIERNAHAATRALSCCHFALLSDGLHRISFDDVVTVMAETGRALPALYRETSTGGLAQLYHRRISEHHAQKKDPDKPHD
ncbi:MAG: L-serine ammonia-lyase, iron-sulfur-dependent, subunit alpha [Syntrophaceae bacterium]